MPVAPGPIPLRLAELRCAAGYSILELPDSERGEEEALGAGEGAGSGPRRLQLFFCHVLFGAGANRNCP